ncbi:hypothetical protein TNCV_3044011 [Trichonephila clavipes]|nr:hypothetical protein TNCV_3044011 [Trichonephila clavipes]
MEEKLKKVLMGARASRSLKTSLYTDHFYEKGLHFFKKMRRRQRESSPRRGEKGELHFLSFFSTRITSPDTFRLIIEKNTSPYLWRPRLMFSVPQYLIFSAGCSEKDASDWTPDKKTSLCKMAVDCFPGKIFSRHSSKILSKLKNRCLTMSLCA